MSAKVINDGESKNRVVSFVIFLIFVFLIGSLVMMVVKDINEKRHNHIKEISYQTYKQEIAKDDYTIVLLARPDCSHCLKYKPLMNQVLETYNLSAYYIDVGNLEYEQYIELHDSVSAVSTEFDSNKNPVIPTPTTVIFKNGKELESISANIGYEGFLNLLERNGVVNNDEK